MSNEEQFWRQKSRVKWLRLGDQNSRYFHSVVRQRRFRALIHRIRDGSGNWITDDNAIGAEAVRYFGDLFSADFVPNFQLMHVIPNVNMVIDNGKLEQVPSMEEVKKVIFDMDGDSVAGPYRFTGKCFTFAWEVVAQDLYKAIVSFFHGAELPRFITATSIVLIPKVNGPQDFGQFRLISSFTDSSASSGPYSAVHYITPTEWVC